MQRFKDITGQKFGRLTVLEFVGKDKWRAILWRCHCECGSEVIVRNHDLRSDHTKSCGCFRLERLIARSRARSIHNGTQNRLYSIWRGMKARCLSPYSVRFSRYGGRGIKICDAWMDFNNFCDWALSNGYREGLTIDRINNDGNYEPKNCQWLTKSENTRKGNFDRKKRVSGALT